MDFILSLTRALLMAKDLPIYMRIPVVIAAWGIALFAVSKGLEAFISLFR